MNNKEIVLSAIKECTECGVITNNGLYFKVRKSEVISNLKDDDIKFYITTKIYKVGRKVMIIT